MSNTMDSFRPPSRTGTRFRYHKLFRFKQHSIEVLKAWPDIRGWKKSRAGWKHCRPEIRIEPGYLPRKLARLSRLDEDDPQLVFPWAVQPQHASEVAELRWLSEIPVDVRRQVAFFPDRHFHLLSFFARSSSGGRKLCRSLDLCRSSPALVYALASSWCFQPRPVTRPHRSIRALLERRTEHEMLNWLGFGDRGVAKLFRRITRRSITVERLMYLQDVFTENHDLLNRLQHCHRLNAGSLRILTDPSFYETAPPPESLVQEIARSRANDRRAVHAYLLRDVREMCTWAGWPIAQPRSIRQLEADHDDLVQQVNRRNRDEPGPVLRFPEPPVQGTDCIVPIEDSRELEIEGDQMTNCVSSYAVRVLSGKSYIFSVRTPTERATLDLVKRNGEWNIGQLKGPRNRSVKRSTRTMVRKWLQNKPLATDADA